MADLKKVLENLWGRKKLKKEAHAGRGQETKWEISNFKYTSHEIFIHLRDSTGL